MVMLLSLQWHGRIVVISRDAPVNTPMLL